MSFVARGGGGAPAGHAGRGLHVLEVAVVAVVAVVAAMRGGHGSPRDRRIGSVWTVVAGVHTSVAERACVLTLHLLCLA